MRGFLKSIQSVLLALVIIAAIGTGVILWFNTRGGNTEETPPDTETEVSVDIPENSFPGGVSPAPTLSGNNVSGNTSAVHEHTYVPSVIQEPACTRVGQMKYSCKGCNDYYIEAIAALEHKAGEWKTVKKATKTVNGLKQQRCVRCNALMKEEVIKASVSGNGTSGNGISANDPSHRHSYKTTTSKEADCFENGEVIYKCSCGSSYTLSIPARNHPSRQTIVSENDCATPTTVICSCAICKTIISQDTIPAVGHNFSDWTVTKTATTSAPGSRSRTCSKCGTTQTEEIPQVSQEEIDSGNHTHSYTPKITTAATCTTDGVLTNTCPVCNDTYTEPIVALGHNPGNWVTVSEPTPETPGLREKYCRRCGELTSKEDIPYVPTHTHSYSWKNTKAPTCTTTGTRTYTCSECGYYYTTNLDMIPHKYTDYVNSEGVTESKCQVCGQLEK